MDVMWFRHLQDWEHLTGISMQGEPLWGWQAVSYTHLFSPGKEKRYRSHRVLPGNGAEASFYRKRRNQILFETFSYRRLLYDCLLYTSQQGGFEVPVVIDKIFKEHPEMKEEVQEKLEKYNLTEATVEPQNPNTTKKFTKQHLMTDTGIELKIPMDCLLYTSRCV